MAKWAYICFVTMETDGTLEKHPTLEWMARQCSLDYDEFQQATGDLMQAGLLDKCYRVVNYGQRQYVDESSAKRSKAYRDRQKAGQRDGHGDGDVTAPVIRHDSEAEAEAEAEAELHTEQEPEKKKNVTSGKSPCPYAKIVAYLNTKAGTAFSEQGKATRRMLKARWDEGYKLEDFQAVIDDRVGAWLNDGDMRQYLRPATLFNATKFESYIGGLSAGGVSGMDWVPKEFR